MDGGEERKGYSESDPDSDPHIHPTVYFLSKQTDYTVSQYTGWKMDGGGDMKQGGERPDVNRGLDRERESSTICILKDSKRKEMLQGMEEWDLLFTSKCETTSFAISLILKFLGNTLNGFLLRVK